MPLKPARWLVPLTALLLASLACTTFNDIFNFELPDPEGLATDAVGTVVPPTRTPRPATATPVAASTNEAAGGTAAPTLTPLAPAGDLPFTLDEADDAQAAMRPDFTADIERLPDASRYVIDVAVTFNSDGTATLTGREAIRYTNTSGTPLNELYLM